MPVPVVVVMGGGGGLDLEVDAADAALLHAGRGELEGVGDPELIEPGLYLFEVGP